MWVRTTLDGTVLRVWSMGIMGWRWTMTGGPHAGKAGTKNTKRAAQMAARKAHGKAVDDGGEG